MILNEYFVLKNGVRIPKVGLGTWQIAEGEDAYNSVTYALRNGYRHIDTAAAYGNEKSVGKAIRDSGIPRNEVFITTKLPAECKGYDVAKQCFDKSLSDLGLDYIDLYIIHAPWPWDKMGMDCAEGNVDSWRAMEEIYESGKARAIGVSNFSPEHLEPIINNCKIIPMCDQISFHIGNRQEETMQRCHELGIRVIAYSPLATGRIIEDEYIAKIAEKYDATIPQICIRYCIQKGNAVIPKSTKEERIISNSKLDFEISKEDMAYLDRK
ncbi:aldo/keto reductase [uncultured Eubacterium sp.]|uniref:aldo/keto reductase n=1 Tax=uncultured Eubacterium sp. TaxID=165185 RepID=UPI002672C440|nr:aldo/keto reductase [uncultured Eubacterium sp.]